METKYLNIGGIPAMIWGPPSNHIYISVHGQNGAKEDAASLAFFATKAGYQVLSFDLPAHGARVDEPASCDVWQGVDDLDKIGHYVSRHWSGICLHAVSIGAYFSLLAYRDLPLEHCLFVSPVVDMVALIQKMMDWANVDEPTLRAHQSIDTDFGHRLDWAYYNFARENPILRWDIQTAILYGAKDELIESTIISDFATRFDAQLTISKVSEHYFHTEEDLNIMHRWFADNISL